MKFPKLRIGELTDSIPIIQGGMGIGISLSGLAGAVAKEGAIGVISAAQPGFNEPDFRSDTTRANCRALAYHLKKARETAPSGILGVNIMTKGFSYSDYAKCAVKNGADIIFSGAGLPADLPSYVKNTKTKIAPIISSARAYSVLLKLWERHHQTTADLVVIEGPKAGGHLGYSREDIKRYEHQGYEKEIKEIPVVFGGGVFDKNDIARYLSLGLSGVQMATRFVATKECDASEAFKEMYIKAKKEDITIVDSPVHMPGRAILNPFVRKMRVCRENITKCFHCLKTCQPQSTPYCITMALIRAARDDVDNALVFCGENAYKIHKMTTVPELLNELTGE